MLPLSFLMIALSSVAKVTTDDLHAICTSELQTIYRLQQKGCKIQGIARVRKVQISRHCNCLQRNLKRHIINVPKFNLNPIYRFYKKSQRKKTCKSYNKPGVQIPYTEEFKIYSDIETSCLMNHKHKITVE